MKKFIPALLCATLLLAACGEGELANASTTTAAAIAGQGFTGTLRSGLYKVVQTGDADDESERCITANMIAKGNYASDKDLQPGWTIVRNRMTGGVIDFEAKGPATGVMVFSGHYTATSFTLDAAMTFENKGEVITLKNHQVGTFAAADCGEGEAEG